MINKINKFSKSEFTKAFAKAKLVSPSPIIPILILFLILTTKIR